MSPLQVAVPMRVFSAGGASALVPNIPGWRFSGANGAIDGFRLDQGGFALGIPMALGGYVPSGTCITSVWAPGVGATVTGIAAVPGSGGVLGANFESAYCTVTFVSAGRAYEALFLAGSNDLMFYCSYVAVAAGGPGCIGLALLDTWRTWDPSAAVNVRLNQILATILTTPIPGSPIDPEVFDRANEAWSAYLRM